MTSRRAGNSGRHRGLPGVGHERVHAQRRAGGRGAHFEEADGDDQGRGGASLEGHTHHTTATFYLFQKSLCEYYSSTVGGVLMDHFNW